MTTAAGAVVPLLVLVGLLVADPSAAVAEERGSAAGRALLDELTGGAPRVEHRGEVLCITWSGNATFVETVDVVGSSAGLLLHTATQGLVRLSGHEAGRDPYDKYQVRVTGMERLLDRPATRLEVRRRADGLLRERLWVDDGTGLLLRRESYDGDDLLRLAAYQTLDLGAGSRRERRVRTAVPAEGWGMSPAADDAEAVPAATRVAWDPPPELPGGYRSAGTFASRAGDSRAAQHVYADGLYSVSVFSQPGRPDWDTLPPGAKAVEGSDGRAYEWPGAVPQRLVWEASGATFTLVGDAPPAEFAAIAEALPHPSSPTVLGRLGDGFARLWGLMAS